MKSAVYGSPDSHARVLDLNADEPNLLKRIPRRRIVLPADLASLVRFGVIEQAANRPNITRNASV